MPRPYQRRVPVVPSSKRDWRTIRETADHFGAAPGTIQKWINTGLLPAHRIGPRGEWRVRVADFDAVVIHSNARRRSA